MTRQRPRIALLDASHGSEYTRRNFRREVPADLAEFDVTEGELPRTFEYDGVVVTGSRASVYWEEPWISDLLAWVREAVDRGLPFLGVCFGHQVLAEALGGHVEDMDAYEIGYREVRHSGDSRLFEGVDKTFTVFTTHSDAVTELPPGARQIAENDYGIHGFEIEDDDVFAVQFHPEYDMETARELAEGKELTEERLAEVLSGITEENYAAACEAKQVFDNFVEHVEEVQAKRAAAD
jgi:GMP synthase (glutamine-hydrolysing)